jgi:CHAD domain-containing protein
VIDQARTQELFRKQDQLLAKSRAKPLPDRVHHIRTTARRLESLLDVLYPEPTARVRKLRRGLKRLRRRAGEVRDIDVQILALRNLNIGREAERKARLMQALVEMRADGEQRLVTLLQDKKIRKLRRRLQRTAAEIAAAAMPANGAATAAPAWVEFNAASASLRMFAGVIRQTKTLTAETLHPFRTACKRVRYLAEMAGPEPAAKRIVDLLKRIQDAAGDWHDWVTLTATAEQVFRHDGALVSALHNVTQAKFHEALAVATAAKRELMAMYRALLARRREQRPPAKSVARATPPRAVSAA